HTGLAAIYLPEVLKKVSFIDIPYIKAKQLFWGFCLDRTIYNHRYDADALGIDLHAAMVKGIQSQERLVEQLGTHKAIWKNRFLEGISLMFYKRHQRRRAAV